MPCETEKNFVPFFSSSEHSWDGERKTFPKELLCLSCKARNHEILHEIKKNVQALDIIESLSASMGRRFHDKCAFVVSLHKTLKGAKKTQKKLLKQTKMGET